MDTWDSDSPKAKEGGLQGMKFRLGAPFERFRYEGKEGPEETGGYVRLKKKRQDFQVEAISPGPKKKPTIKRTVMIGDSESEEEIAEPSAEWMPQTEGDVHAVDDDSVEHVAISSEPETSVERGRDTLMETCERISRDLKSTLETKFQFSTVEPDSAKGMVSADAVIQASGQTTFTLKPYQLVGVNFMLLLNEKGVSGSILADEMGLGKTAQAISFLSTIRATKREKRPHLIVAPGSLLENWERELSMWCPALRVVRYHGTNRAAIREEIVAGGISSYDPPFDVMLVTYTLFERDGADQRADRSFLRKWEWSHLVLDEAHLIKNPSSSRAKKLWLVADKCQRRILLTGTPLQNDLAELQSLLHFCMPDIFDLDTEALEEAKTDPAKEKEVVARMKRLLEPFILRRIKSDVAKQLTPKSYKLEKVTMATKQQQLYHLYVKQARSQMSLGSNAEEEGKALENILQQSRKDINHIFSHLRKLSNHPLLIRSLFSDEDVQSLAKLASNYQLFGDQCTLKMVEEELRGYSDFQIHEFASENANIKHFQRFILDPKHFISLSGKAQALARLLPELKTNGHRPLIFSQWTSTLDIIEVVLEQLGMSFVRLDGQTKMVDRQDLVDRYNAENSDIFAFLLTSRAGGVGLNLTGADSVILHDVDFNPQTDRQAEDRCHRIGQSKPVTVYRLVCKGTVDEKIYDIANRKLVLDAAILGESSSSKNAGEDKPSARIMAELLASAIAGGA